MKKYLNSILTTKEEKITYIKAISITEAQGVSNINKNIKDIDKEHKRKTSLAKTIREISKIRSNLAQINNPSVDPKQKHN